jgi:hypothetical protein
MVKLLETKVVFEVTLHHWSTSSPQQIVESAKSLLTQFPKMVPDVAVLGTPTTKEIPMDIEQQLR